MSHVRILSKYTYELKGNYKQGGRVFDQIQQHGNPSALTSSPPARFMSVLRENTRLSYDYSVQDGICQNGVAVYLPAEAPTFGAVRIVDTAIVDYTLLGSWLEHCQTSHAICRQVRDGHTRLPYTYLIDCIEEKVVCAKTNEQYFTLSYVWGKNTQNRRQPCYQWKLPEELFSYTHAPLTVQDAIQFVRGLGKRYLWVDRYCVNQEQSSEKELMIRNMDQIYEFAEAKIVALYDENDDAGLPGISIIRRTPQPRFPMTSGCLISYLPPVTTLFANSTWNTRGWT
jgi:hypothetical protein